MQAQQLAEQAKQAQQAFQAEQASMADQLAKAQQAQQVEQAPQAAAQQAAPELTPTKESSSGLFSALVSQFFLDCRLSFDSAWPPSYHSILFLEPDSCTKKGSRCIEKY